MKRVILFVGILFVSEGHALGWSDFWFNKDQQAQLLMEKGQFVEAEATFERKDWLASAAYRAGDYEHAAELFGTLKTKDGYYNQGNALAHLGQYEKAIESYDRALQIEPNDEDALYNRQLVEDLMKKDKDKQENKNSESQQNKDQQNKDQQNKDQQNKDQQNKDQQNKDQQNKDQQNKDQQNKDQKNKDQKKGDNKQSRQEDQSKKKTKKTTDDVEQSQQEKEKQQAKEQWLRLIPDDPGGLMREKFLRDHLRRQRGWYQ